MGIKRRIPESLVKTNHPVLLYDGVCNLCNNTVQFILKKNKKQNIYFAALQSDYGQNILSSLHFSTQDLSSLIFIEDHQIYTQSTGALRLSRHLGFWKIFYAFIIVPSPIRNWVYRRIAKNRYKWFGKNEECLVPSPETKARFLDI